MGVRRASALAAKASAAPQWEKRRVRREGQRRVQRTSGAAQCSASSATTHAREAQPAAGWVQRTEFSGRAVVRRLSEVGYARRGFAKLQNTHLRGGREFPLWFFSSVDGSM